jgi:hypothetical protein
MVMEGWSKDDVRVAVQEVAGENVFEVRTFGDG